MSCADSNPAAMPTPCVDIQGDGRWMSLVCFSDKFLILYFNLKIQPNECGDDSCNPLTA